MNRDSLLTTTGKAKKPGLVLAFREAGALWVEEELFWDFSQGLSPAEYEHIEQGHILFLTRKD